MKRLYHLILVLTLLSLVPIHVSEGSPNDEYYIEKMKSKLRDAGYWMIEEGLSLYSAQGYDSLKSELFTKWLIVPYSEPMVETDRYLVRCNLKGRGIFYEIFNHYRERVDDYYYEFWQIQITGRSWSGVSERTMFFVTRASDIYGNREIIVESDQFLDHHQVDCDVVIVFPKGDLQVLYDLNIQYFLDHFRDSDLRNCKVIIDENGNYVKISIPEDR